MPSLQFPLTHRARLVSYSAATTKTVSSRSHCAHGVRKKRISFVNTTTRKFIEQRLCFRRLSGRLCGKKQPIASIEEVGIEH